MSLEDFKYILIPVTALVSSQVIKFIIETIKYKKVNIERLLNGNGGMPSSHSATSFSIVTAIGMAEGFNSPIFALGLVFACIVAYDASGVRMETGKQAVVINELVDVVKDKKKNNLEFKKLKEQLGHKPLEVFFGILLGIAIGLIYTV